MPIFPSFFVNKTGGYEIEQSLRFDGGGSKLVLSSPSSSYTTNKFTLSCWVKLGPLSSPFTMMNRDGAPNNVENTWCIFNAFSNNVIVSYMYTASINGRQVLNTAGVQRDPSAWYHIVFGYDSGTGNTQRIWVNGVEQTNSLDTISGVAGFAWSSTYPFVLGGGTSHAYCAEYHFVDGTWLNSPDDFGEFNDQGVWVPKEYTGSHGTNGFYLKFDPSATNGIGHDHSGTGNHLTATGFTTSGTGTDVMSDTPTTNWATLNPLSPSQSQAALSNGNIDCTWSGVSGHSRRSTIAMGSGKWYAEITRGTSTLSVGLVDADIKLLSWPGNSTYGSTGSYAYRTDNGNKYNNGNASSYGNTIATGDVIGIAYDGDNGALYFSKNGTWQNSGDPTSGASATGAAFTGLGNQTWTIACGNAGGSTGGTATNFNFGQRDFEYTPPTGFKALNTSNLPAPTVKDGSKNFNTVLYTGDGTASRSLTGVGFAPSFVWIKNRDVARSNSLHDIVRGTNEYLISNSTGPELTDAGLGLASFDSDGFTLGTSTTSGGGQNGSGEGYVAWNWLAGGSGSSNTNGTITSTVSANATAGFSIVSYTGDGTQFATIGHGLGVAPKMVIVKNRDSTNGWAILHTEVGTTGTTLDGAPEYYMMTFTTNGRQNFGSDSVWDPTSTTFKVAATTNANWVNGNGSNYIAYCFAEVEGYSKFGSYTGNGSTDGPFVATSFTPAFLIWKRTDTSANWFMVDAVRNTYNPVDKEFYPDQPNAENTFTDVDFLSNGFKLRASAADRNANGGTFIYMCFASNPFGGSGVSPATAR